MNNIFANGIRLTDGVPYQPSISFLDKPSTGIFRTNDNKLGFAINGSSAMSISSTGISINKGLNLTKGAVSNAYLRGNENGDAYWQQSPTQSGEVSWNSIYNTLNINSANDSLDITFNEMDGIPNIVISRESDAIVANNDFYIKNKTTNSCVVYSSLPVLTNVSPVDTIEISMCRLDNGCLGVCYYDISQDRVIYKYSMDSDGKVWSDAIIPDDDSSIGLVNLIVVDGFPAIAYIYNDGVNDEWRYIRATDSNGSVWGAYVTLVTSTTGVNFLPVTLNLLNVNGAPAVFYNDENGRAKVIHSNDSDGTSWGSSINISNLTNHQIMNVKIVNGNPAVVAKSNAVNNVYYVRANNAGGTSWPVAASQLYKNVNNVAQTITVNGGYSSCDMSMVDGSLCIAISELSSNDLFLNVANDINGASWKNFNIVMSLETAALYPKFFTNNNKSYLLFNKSNGIPSTKCLLKFESISSYSINDAFMPVFNIYGDHQIIPNMDDDNSLILFTSQNNVSLLRFYDDNFKLNWIAHL
jgi:hypothetical protein